MRISAAPLAAARRLAANIAASLADIQHALALKRHPWRSIVFFEDGVAASGAEIAAMKAALASHMIDAYTFSRTAAHVVFCFESDAAADLFESVILPRLRPPAHHACAA